MRGGKVCYDRLILSRRAMIPPVFNRPEQSSAGLRLRNRRSQTGATFDCGFAG